MAVLEQIQEKVKLLPEPIQYQVLDFVDYMLHRSRQEDLLWSKLLLRWALRGLEDFDEVIAADASDFEQSGLKTPSVIRVAWLAVVSDEMLPG